MNRKETEKLMEVMLAYINGETIQFRPIPHQPALKPQEPWRQTSSPEWSVKDCEYRVEPLYVDFKIDDKVLVRKPGCYSHEWTRRYFAGVNENSGKPMTWEGCGTSWNTKSKTSWDECKLPEEEAE